MLTKIIVLRMKLQDDEVDRTSLNGYAGQSSEPTGNNGRATKMKRILNPVGPKKRKTMNAEYKVGA